MRMRDLRVYRVEYEQLDNIYKPIASWTAKVLGTSHEDVIAYLVEKMGRVNVTSIGVETDVHAITTGIVRQLYEAVQLLSPAEKPLGVVMNEVGKAEVPFHPEKPKPETQPQPARKRAPRGKKIPKAGE